MERTTHVVWLLGAIVAALTVAAVPVAAQAQIGPEDTGSPATRPVRRTAGTVPSPYVPGVVPAGVRMPPGAGPYFGPRTGFPGAGGMEGAPPPCTMGLAVLRVTYDEDSLPGGSGTLAYIAQSDAVLKDAVRETLDKPVDVRVNMRVLQEAPRRTGTTALVQLDLVVLAEVPQAQVRKLLAAVTGGLDKALANSAAQQRELIRKELLETATELDKAKSGLADAQKARAQIVTQSGMGYSSSKTILSRIADLESKRQSLEVEVAGLRVRVKAMQDQVARLAAKAEAAAKDDPVAAELAKVVEFREFELKRGEEAHRQGVATKSEVMQAAAQVAEVKARLAERRQQAVAAAAGELLTALNHDLVHDSIRLVEKEAELEAVTSQLKPLRDPKLLGLSAQYDTLSDEVSMAERRFQTALQRQSDLQSRLAAVRAPTIIVIGA